MTESTGEHYRKGLLLLGNTSTGGYANQDIKVKKHTAEYDAVLAIRIEGTSIKKTQAHNKTHARNILSS